MTDPMQEIRASFFVECEELMEALHDGLEALQDGASDGETINIVFRAVHSIKGGAGAFGLEQLVGFTHRFETALDETRAGRLAVDPPLLALYFQCADVLSDLVRVARDGGTLPEGELAPVLEELEARLPDAAPEDAAPVATAEAPAFQPMAISLDLPGLEPTRTTFRITFQPEPELLESGHEPLFLFRALADLGPLHVTADRLPQPDFAALAVATPLLSWRLTLETDADAAAIREIFEFTDGLCRLEITEGDLPADPAEPVAPHATMPEPAPPETADAVATDPDAATTAPPEGAAQQPIQARQKATVRVDLERIDRLVNLVGELVINQSMLTQSVAASGLSGNSQIASGLDEFQQLTRDIQDSVMMIRAQPVKSLFQRMGRIVRESSHDVGKQVRLKTEGEATEIDKTVIERLADPLTHMIRNAVDHGLEATEERRAAGKPAEGIVTLNASHRSGRVVIEVGDDGGGINRDKVRRIAEEKGLIEDGRSLTETEIDNLLFLPGFSTAKTVSNLSGRGVGMDVVKNAISALGGRISIASRPGEGTTFSISLPLTLAVLDGMVVTVAGETLVVPLSAIAETLSLGPEDIRPLGPSTHVIRVRDSFVPLIDLATELGYAPPRTDPSAAIGLLIAQEDGTRAALVVDAIDDQRQVVIKGLQDSYGHVPGIAAATILGDGQIALILDPVDLLTRATGRSRTDLARIA